MLIFVELPVEYYPEVGMVSGLGFALGGPFVGFHRPGVDQGSPTGGVKGAATASAVPDDQIAAARA